MMSKLHGRLLGRFIRMLTAGFLVVCATLMVAQQPAVAATGYTPRAGAMEVYATCHRDSYAYPTPNTIAVSARAYMESGFRTQEVGLELWFYRLESKTWERKWLGTAVVDGYSSARFDGTWVLQSGSYYVVGRFHYRRLDGTWAKYDLPVSVYNNYRYGINVGTTVNSCRV